MNPTSERLSSAPPGGNGLQAVALEQILGDLVVFDNDILHRQPFVRDLHDAPLSGLLSLDDVDHLLTGAGLRTPFVSLVDTDRVIPEDQYCRQVRIGATTVPDLVHPGRVLDNVRSGATLILQGMQRYWPPVARLCREAEARWGYASHANAYLTPPGAQGFAEHEDGHDTLLIQTHGAKRWTVAQPPTGATVDLRDDAGRWTFTLTAPAVLYIPAGTRHAGVTTAESSLHVTLGLTRWTWERVARHLTDLALGSLELTGHLPTGALSGRRDFNHAVSELADRIADAVRGLSPETAIRSLTAEFIDKSPPLPSGHLRHALGLPV